MNAAPAFTHPSRIRAVKRRAVTAELTPATRLVLGALCDRIDGVGQCHPSHDTLAEEAGVSRRTVIRSVQSLERTGIIVRHVPPPKVRARRGPESTTRYLIRFDTAAPEARDISTSEVTQVRPVFEAKAGDTKPGNVESTTSFGAGLVPPIPGTAARDIAPAKAGDIPGPSATKVCDPEQSGPLILSEVLAEKAGDTVAVGTTDPAEKARDMEIQEHVTLMSRKEPKKEEKETCAHTHARKNPDPKQVTLDLKQVTTEQGLPIVLKPARNATQVPPIQVPTQLAALVPSLGLMPPVGGSRQERSTINRTLHAVRRQTEEMTRGGTKSHRPGDQTGRVIIPEPPTSIAPPRAIVARTEPLSKADREAAAEAIREIRLNGFKVPWGEAFQRALSRTKASRGS
jgi:hypothetical protein